MVTKSHADFENRYGDDSNTAGEDYRNKGSRPLGKGASDATAGEQVDEYGRVSKGPYTLRNGAQYTGQWLDG